MKKIILGTIIGAASLMAASWAPCAACHGATAEKSALGKSQIIQGWEASKIEAALNGYKDGSYGGPMKGVMKGQVARLSEADIKDLAGQISKF
ncbi:MAG: c-type cytochrome [Arcobacteraceae bacterium]